MPRRIGRFAMLEPIGRGGMGAVYAAYDGQLRRKVAIKLLHEDHIRDRVRFRREAQGLARLSHPHVVVVHEVGESDGRVFLAMEYIQGSSLDVWLRNRPDWKQVLEVFAKAGQGLMAAHEAELIHRDFKPANVIRGEDGVVKVLDFGLVRLAHDVQAPLKPSDRSSSCLSTSLTETGGVIGTPLYMAPEQLAGEAADASSDQFSFCAALWEALTGVRAHDGSDVDDLLSAKLTGPPTWPTDAPPVPKTIVDAVRRGLAVEPQQRWPSMAPILRELTQAPRRDRNHRAVGLVAVASLGLAGLATAMWPPATPTLCRDSQDRLTGIWDPMRRDQVQAAIMGSGFGYAPVVWNRTRDALNEYAETWVSMHADACEATSIRGEQPARMLDLRMACLHRATQTLRATVDTLIEADATVVEKAHELVSNLRPLPHCEDIEALESEVEPPGEQDVEAVDIARGQLARVRSLCAAARYDDAQLAVEAAATVLAGIDYLPAAAELALERGTVAMYQGEYEQAERWLNEALERATRLNSPELVGEAGTTLMEVLGVYQGRPEDALFLRSLVMGAAEEDPVRRANVRRMVGVMLSAIGRHQEAEAELRAALEFQEAIPDHDLHLAAVTRNALAGILYQQGRFDEAEDQARRVQADLSPLLGEGHPTVIVARNTLAGILYANHDYAAAEDEFRATVVLWTELLGPDHADLGNAHNNLGVVLREQGKFAQSEAEHRRELAILQANGNPNPIAALSCRRHIGAALWEQGKYEDAQEELRAALSDPTSSSNSERLQIAKLHHALAGVLGDRGLYGEAERHYWSALKLLQTLDGPDDHVASIRADMSLALLHQGRHDAAELEARAAVEALAPTPEPPAHATPAHAKARAHLAEVLLERSRFAEALPLAEEAWAQRTDQQAPAHDLASSAFVLAKLLWSIEGSSRDRERATAIAQDAQRAFASASPRHARQARQVEQWLESRRP